jgi:Restriction endonuclease S subunits
MSQTTSRWPEVDLKAVVRPRKRKADPKLLSDLPFIGLEHVEAHTGRLITYGNTRDVKSAVNLFEAGDVLYARLRPYLNKVIRPTFSGAASAEFIVLPGNENIDARFLQFVLMQEAFVSFASHINQGDRPRVDFEQIGIFRFPLPPIAEQRRIVARLDSLLAQSKAARAELNKALALAKRQRQAVLAKAFSGELTQDWREERETAFNAGNAWEETTLEALAEVGTGATPKRGNPKYYENGTIPWVTSAVVNDLVVTRAEELITQVALEETNCKVFPKGTILLAMYGEGKTRGQVTILGIEAATNQALAAIRIKPQSRILQDFVLWFLRSNYLMLRQQAAGGVQPNLNLRIIKNISVPLPSLEEQKEIVKRVEAAFAQIETMENEAKKALALAERLEQATLAKAFQGQL